MQLANREAMHSGHPDIGTVDILIALVATGDDVATKFLRSLRIYSSEIRNEVARHSTGGVEDGKPRAKQVIENAITVAQELNHSTLDSEHLLLGLLNDHDSLACRTLAGLGINLDQLRSDIWSRLTPGSAT